MSDQVEMQRVLAAMCQESGLRTDGEINHLVERISFALKSRSLAIQALTKIAAIEDELHGGDWDEIDEARDIANAALGNVVSSQL